MTTYTSVFGGANIYPSEISYSALALTADVVLSWPEETSANDNLATKIIDVTGDVADWSVFLPDATKTGTGQTVLFNNYGATEVLVKSSTGVQLIVMAPGTSWQIYLTNNSTASGSWRAFQYGAALSSANASALAGTGLIAIGSVLEQNMPVSDFNSSYAAGATDRSKFFVWTGAGGTLDLPLPADVGDGWFINVSNQGQGALSVDPASTVLIDGSSSKTYNPGESSMIVSDGTAFYTIGYGKDAVFAFDYTSIDVAGSGNYTLSGSELNRIAYDFTGTLTGARNIIVPATVQQYWVTNDTSGAYTFTIKTASGSGVSIDAGQSAIVYCNGTNVVPADTAGLSTPISIANGGTGATTASGARINLGGTSVGIALFTAVDVNSALSTLGASAIGEALFTAADHAAVWATLGAVDGGVF